MSFGHPDDECLDLFRTPGATWSALLAAVVLLVDELSVPTQKRIGCDDAGKLPQGRASHDLGLLSEPPSLGVGEAQPFVAHLFTEYAVLLFEVIDCILLCTIDPTRPHHQQKLQRQVHEGYRIPFVQADQTKWPSEERAQDLKHPPIPVSGVLAPYGFQASPGVASPPPPLRGDASERSSAEYHPSSNFLLRK